MPLPAWLVVAIGAAALAATAAAVYTTAVSNHAPNPAGHAALTVVVCLSFVGTGLLALRRSPYVRFGLLLVAAGFAALLGALHDANDAAPVHDRRAHREPLLRGDRPRAARVPEGTARLAHRAACSSSPRTSTCSRCRRSPCCSIRSRAGTATIRGTSRSSTRTSPLSTALEELEAAIAVAIALAVVGVLTRRAKAATPAARRHADARAHRRQDRLLFFSVGLVLAPLSSDLAVIGIGLGMLASLAIPAAFLGVLLQGRLSRAAVGELLVELGRRDGGTRSARTRSGARSATRRSSSHARSRTAATATTAGEPLAPSRRRARRASRRRSSTRARRSACSSTTGCCARGPSCSTR